MAWPTGSLSQQKLAPEDGEAGSLRVLGTRRPPTGEGEGDYVGGGPGNQLTRPLTPRSWRRRLVIVLAKIIAAVVVLVVVATALLYFVTPSAGQATSLVAAQAREHHISYPGPPVPQYFAEALVATEDHRFYTDPGVDPFALVRVTASWLTGHTDGGGSTLDQQLAKNLYTSGHSSFPQIVEQVALAVKLNRAYSRAQILQMYAEIAYYGHGYYGLEAASCGYFGREPAHLTLVQAAMLAGAVNAPTYDDPLTYPAQAHTRLAHVIDRMTAVGYLTRSQQQAALSASLDLPTVRGCQQ